MQPQNLIQKVIPCDSGSAFDIEIKANLEEKRRYHKKKNLANNAKRAEFCFTHALTSVSVSIVSLTIL